MEFNADGNLIARILLTLTVFGYSLGPLKADFNNTHATNPLWTPHARFHVVWQILSYAGIGLIALGLIWLKGPLVSERLYLAAGLGFVVYAAFFGATFSRPLFGGALTDPNGYPSFRPPFGPSHWRWDVNVTVFTVMSMLWTAAIATIR
jgi:hypothetical protein